MALRDIIVGFLIWIPVIPIFILDIFIEIYHHISFPLAGLEKVDRKKYVRIDRGKLPYLNWLQKINCMYCGYVNGIIIYWKEIVARTERMYCPLKHMKVKGVVQQDHHTDFVPWNDEVAFKKSKLTKHMRGKK